MEIWDMYDENRNLLTNKHIRGEEIQKNEYHVIVSVLVINDNNEVLLTKRDPRKDFGNLWENTAGSLIAGETSKQGALRELREETGIVVNEEELVFLGTLKEISCFADNYIVRKNININDVILQEGETIDSKIVSLDTFNKMIENNEVAGPTVDRFCYIKDKFVFNI